MLIDTCNLRVGLGGKAILHGVNLSFEAGDVYGLIGPNGAGKSTTIAAALGLVKVSGGTVRVLGADRRRESTTIYRRLGGLPEHYGWMSAREYLAFFACLYRQQRSDRDLNIRLASVGLATGADRPIATFSQGMRQRLSLARALIGDPELLILDEPTNGLDPRGRREVHDILLALSVSQGVGILLSTHLLDDVDRLCGHLGIIVDGRTVAEGAVADVLRGHRQLARFRLRLAGPSPDMAALPDHVALVAREGEWCIVDNDPSLAPADAWRELLFRGWPLVEVRTEGGGLESLYLVDNAQVVYDTDGLVTALGALLAVVVATDAIADERERGSLVPLLLTPGPRPALVIGKLGGQLIVWAVMFAIAIPYLCAVGSTGQNLAESILILALFGTPTVLGFGSCAIGLAARMASARSCLLIGLIALVLSESPLLLGPSLRQTAGKPGDRPRLAGDRPDVRGRFLPSRRSVEATMRAPAPYLPRHCLWSRTRPPPHLAGTPLTVALTPAADNARAPQMGDRLTFHSVIRNDSTVPLNGIIGRISLVRGDPGEEQPVDLEDWSAQKALAVARLAPDEAIETVWPMRLIQAGRYRVAVSVVAGGSAVLAASPFVDFAVREKLVLESQRVLPVALGIPLLLVGLLAWCNVRGRWPRGSAWSWE